MEKWLNFKQQKFSLSVLVSFVVPEKHVAYKKTVYIISHWLAPYCVQLLIQNVTASPCHLLSFDESLHKKIYLGQMDIFVRFLNVIKEPTGTQYRTSEFIFEAYEVFKQINQWFPFQQNLWRHSFISLEKILIKEWGLNYMFLLTKDHPNSKKEL